MPVSTVASIKLRGTLVTGRVATGAAAGGMKVILTHKGENTLLTCVEVDPATDDPSLVGTGQVVGLYLQDQAGNDLNHRHVRASRRLAPRARRCCGTANRPDLTVEAAAHQ